MKKIVLTVTLASALALGACTTKAPDQLPSAPVSTATPAPSAPRPAPLPTGPVPGSYQDFLASVAGQVQRR
jgi:peptidoglycan-associated lipoprotein